ncbi:AAA family ATPase [Saccharobesus litoralis]|uniref:AAA family ATPase n=1 Tax=Saccharobesus litoralis TaxID=2172099 RepID=A0A2S0VRV3_9ALTE|nr:AAA family ATPase [Saccharobesus litoralis]AWB66830.1 AAA family ATPase [Saccharobesus litoralis]
MYKGFFGLKETPFSIAPNPQYLFMSDRHKEALAHLMFGLRETGGFVLLTGEVGTGKTTTSRCLLEQVPDDTQVAFILNPTLSEHELLATICDELKIKTPADATLKQLTDSIRDFLLANHKADKNALLIIDEAQHLRAEVLEQLRLLTNLETNTKKLLQVILIGQPELQDLLKRRELRQLAQRITARYHLLPLTINEVAAYIVHRLAVAGCERSIFTQSAIKQIHALSGGIPRIINLLCDRALMGAYGQSKLKVDAKIIRQAAVEALGQDAIIDKPLALSRRQWQLIAAVGICACLGAGWWLGQAGSTSEPTVSVQTPVTKTNSTTSTTTSINDADNSTNQNSNKTAQAMDAQPATVEIDFAKASSSALAFKHLLQAWRVEIDGEMTEPCQQINEWQLNCYSSKGNLPNLVSLNYPALLQLYQANGEVFYGVLEHASLQNNVFSVVIAGQQHQVDRTWFDQYWRGGAVIVWQQPEGYQGQIDANSGIESLQWLENSLAFQQNRRARKIGSFDSQLQRKLHQFQNELGLALTPFADEETLIALHHQNSNDGPTLTATKQASLDSVFQGGS